jgi:hypothetical protein
MNRVIFLLLAGVFWAVMTALLFQREILPYLEFQDPPSYRSFLRNITEPELSRQNILMSGKPVGEIETVVLPSRDGSFEIRSWVRFELPDGKVTTIATRRHIDRAYRMIRETTRTRILGIDAISTVERTGEKMRLQIEVPALKYTNTINDLPFEKDEMLADPFVPYYGGKLSVGKKWKVKTLDATGSSPSMDMKVATTDLYATVEERKRIRYQGKEIDCYEVVFRKRPTKDEDAISHIVYVNDSGVTIASTLFLGKFVYDIRLVEKRPLTADEAADWKTTVPLPAGFTQP